MMFSLRSLRFILFTYILKIVWEAHFGAHDSRSSGPSSQARHFTPEVRLSTQVYKWVRANLMMFCNPVMD